MNGLTSDGTRADTAAGCGKRMQKQIQVAGHEARVRTRRQEDDNSALLCRFKRSEGGIPCPGKLVEDDKTVEWSANEFAAQVSNRILFNVTLTTYNASPRVVYYRTMALLIKSCVFFDVPVDSA